MKSMTGYGKATAVANNRELVVELKSVNHRFLDISTKIPRMFIAYEDIIRSSLSKNFSRGHIDVFLNYTCNDNDDRQVRVDYALADKFVETSRAISDKYGIKNDFQVNALLRTNDVIKVEQVEEDEEVIRQLVVQAVDNACIQLTNMRVAEGEKLLLDISTRIDNIKNILDKIKTFAPSVIDNYRDKLTQRVTEVLGGIEVDSARLVNEVAFFVDKSNIDEEISRLYCHIDNAKVIMDSNEPIGRKLDFLIQEFNREANTICSKSNDVAMTNLSLELKNEIEKVREQVQNAE